MLHSMCHLNHISRFAYGCKIVANSIGMASSIGNSFCMSNYSLGKPFPINKGMCRSHKRLFSKKVKDMWWFTEGVSDKCPTVDVHPARILEGSSHRDGSIYKFCPGFIKVFHIADRNETCLEPMMLSQPTNCRPDRETCTVHLPSRMMQIFSIKLAQVHMDSGPIQLYGYIAVRDHLDSMLNYVVNRSRDDPIIVQQGSPIEMIGPKQGISICYAVIFEFDMRIKKGEREEDDLELIDGALEYSEIRTPAMRPMTSRVSGNCGAVDITLAYLYQAVEATIQVSISKVHRDFNLSLSAFVLIDEERQEIQLFDGSVGEPYGLRRYVVAVALDTWMYLKFKVCQNGSKNDLYHYCSFKANRHGFSSQQIAVEPGAITVKVDLGVAIASFAILVDVVLKACSDCCQNQLYQNLVLPKFGIIVFGL